MAAAQRLTSTRDSDCSGLVGADSFQGTTSTNRRNLVYEKLGSINRTHRIAYYTADGARLCIFGENVGAADDKAPPSRWIERASRVVLESTSGSTTHRLIVTGGTASQAQFQVNGAPRPIDASVNAWRERMLASLDLMWEATMLRGEQTSLRGQITSIHGEETSLRGQITSLQGEVTSMQGRISSLRGEETSMRGRITSIRGHETSLQGQITSARGAITSINSSNYRQAEADRRIADYEKQIERIEREIRDYNADRKVAEIEKEIEAFNVDRKVAEVEKEIQAFDLDRRVADIERQIEALNVSGKVKGIEEEIRRLDADRRVAEIEKRLGQANAQVKAAIAAIR